jgi:hypothetical protein
LRQAELTVVVDSFLELFGEAQYPQVTLIRSVREIEGLPDRIGEAAMNLTGIGAGRYFGTKICGDRFQRKCRFAGEPARRGGNR